MTSSWQLSAPQDLLMMACWALDGGKHQGTQTDAQSMDLRLPRDIVSLFGAEGRCRSLHLL